MKDILFQMNICWQMFEYHLNELSDEEALWCKTDDGLNVRLVDGAWVADWPETESYDIGPASIAWTLWHIMFWWKNTITASFKGEILNKEDVKWPGSVSAAAMEIKMCHDDWINRLVAMPEEAFESTELCRWPFENESFRALALWLNAEFMKNVAEIGSGRFLYAVSDH